MEEEQLLLLMAALSKKEFKSIEPCLVHLNEYLTLRSYIDGYTLSQADSTVWASIRGNAVAHAFVKRSNLVSLCRWFGFIEQSHPELQQEFIIRDKETKAKKTAESSSGASYNITLQDAEMGKVVTRFCPEPSGYLHVGHAKAALMNDYFAHEMYKGTLILRFDDTNPSKEKREFEDSISEDLALLGIRPDKRSYTSDHFQSLYECCVRLIKAGNAYADDTDQETMRDERMAGKASIRRDRSTEENVRIFEKMIAGTDTRNCIRARISVDNTNKAMRDPVIYRSNSTPHDRTGTLWKAYPTYDFACPLVDSLEGVTHALRSTEFTDRNPQYHWFLERLYLRRVHIWDFGRLNLKRTFMSKRKLAKLVDIGRSTNKKEIDPVAPRHTAIDQKEIVRVTIIGQGPYEAHTEDRPRHSKNAALGTKKVAYSRHLIIEQEDARSFKQNEEVTLMAWGNAIIRKINHRSLDTHSPVTDVEIELHLEGDFKKTEKKITWLSTEGQSLTPAIIFEFDYLLTKDKLLDDENFEDFLTETTEFRTQVFCDGNLADCKKDDIIQLERKGYYRVDTPCKDGEAAVLFNIPTGKTK